MVLLSVLENIEGSPGSILLESTLEWLKESLVEKADANAERINYLKAVYNINKISRKPTPFHTNFSFEISSL